MSQSRSASDSGRAGGQEKGLGFTDPVGGKPSGMSCME